MKRMYFKTYGDFLQELDGKVYAVSNKNGHYLCDIIEDDYLKLLESGIIVDLNDNWKYCSLNADSDIVLTIAMGEEGLSDFKEKFGLAIEIEERGHSESLGNLSIDYELDSLILKSSEDEMETSFVFMDGIAIQINSLDMCTPAINPVILTYPRKNEILNNVRMREEIENYRGHSWNGDFYTIALLYGEEMELSVK